MFCGVKKQPAVPPPVLITCWRRSGAKFSILGAILVSSGAIEVTKLRALEMSSNKGEHESWVTASDSKAISKKKKHCHLGTYFLYNLLTLHLIFSGVLIIDCLDLKMRIFIGPSPDNMSW